MPRWPRLLKKYLLFQMTLVIMVVSGLPGIALSQTPSKGPQPAPTATPPKKTQLTPKELKKAKSLDELLLGKRGYSSIASSYLQKKWELPSAVYVVTSKDVEELGTRRLTDLFRLSPGVSVATLNWGQSSVAIRGLRSPFFGGRFGGQNVYVQAFQDGRNVQSPMFGGTFWEQLPLLLEEIDRIEIMRGPGAALYGANAFDGAINIITKDPEKTHGVRVVTGYGNQQTGFGDIMIGDGIGNFDFRLGTSFEHDAGLGKHNGAGVEDTVRYSKTTFRGKYRFTPEFTAELLGGFTYGNVEMPPSEFDERRRIYNWPYVDFRLKYKVSDTQDILFKYSWQMQSWKEREDLSPIDVQENIQEFELRHNVQLGERNRIVWGANYRTIREKSPIFGGATLLTPRPNPTWASKNVTDHDYISSAFVQDEIKILDNLRLTLGGQLQHNSFTNTDYAARASLVYAPWKDQAFRVSGARSFRQPNFVEDAINLPIDRRSITFDFFGTTFTFPLLENDFVGNKRLENETLRSLELGYTGRFFKKLDVNIEAYFYDYDDLIAPVFQDVTPSFPPLPFIFQRKFVNIENATAKGVEVAVRYPITKWWEVAANYSRADFDDRNKAAFTADDRSVFSPLYPKNMANLNMNFDLPEDFSAHLWLNYSDSIETKRQPQALVLFDVDDYVRVDARVAKGFEFPGVKGEFSIVGQNLLGHHQEGGLVTEPGVVDGVDVFVSELTEVDRKVFFSLDLRF
ncbi:MAG: TonB-dependent receptor plug domain-containing protein [Planctomycetota bacterium]|jgi:iron complex outermembrane receptor protein